MVKIAILMALALQVVLPCAMSEEVKLEEEKARFLPLLASAVGAGGAFGNQHDKGESAAETHNDKQISLDFSKKQGTSSEQSHDRGQQFGAAAGGFAAAPVFYGGGGWNQGGWERERPPHHHHHGNGGWGNAGWGNAGWGNGGWGNGWDRPPHHHHHGNGGWGGWGGR